MIRRSPRSTRTDPLFPYTPLFRSAAQAPYDDEPFLVAGGELLVGRVPGDAPYSAVVSLKDLVHLQVRGCAYSLQLRVAATGRLELHHFQQPVVSSASDPALRRHHQV